VDEIRPEMLKCFGSGGIHWLTRICGVVWKTGRAPVDWQTGIVIPIFKKGDQRESVQTTEELLCSVFLEKSSPD